MGRAQQSAKPPCKECNYLSFRIILEADANSVVERVALRTEDIPLGEQTVAQVRFPLCSGHLPVHCVI